MLGHILFFAVHLIMIAFGFVGLVVSIPMHLIYAATTKKNPRSD